MKIHYLQHVAFEGPALILKWAQERNYQISGSIFYEKCKIPSTEYYDALIIMGGPMSVYDTDIYGWLADEKEHIKEAIDAEKHVLGICLGAQLIADVLGAEVSKAPVKEIGWFPIAWSDGAMGHKIISGLNASMNVLHWHGEQFAIPKGALHLASSKYCPNQAFLYNEHVLGLQFHLEMDEAAIENIIENCGEEIANPSQSIQAATAIRKNAHNNIPACERTLFKLLDNWIAS
jgi:GMP synthase-like glutamine amidotransferase